MNKDENVMVSVLTNYDVFLINGRNWLLNGKKCAIIEIVYGMKGCLQSMIKVNMLGRFQVICDEQVLDGDKIHSMMLMKLFVYLMLHRDKVLTVDEIAMALWRDEETDNPAGALKNLMYRLRMLLKKHFGENDFILTSRGSYQWNPEIEVELDVEKFEAFCEKAKKEEETEPKLEAFEKAIELYQGDFMPKLLDMHWSVTLTTYYHSMFLSCVKGLSEIYKDEERFDELEVLANWAIMHDNLEECFYYYLIYARMKKGQSKHALESYEKACKILYEELGVHNPEKLQEVYEELLQQGKGTKAENIKNVQEDMLEEEPEGAFFCGYPVFKEIYRLEARKITRIGGAEHVLLFTMNSDVGAEQQASLARFRVQKAMEKLESVISNSLRIGDVAARYSDRQFIVLLPFCSYENALMVSERILSNFYGNNKYFKNIKIKVNLEEVVAAEMMMNK